MPNQRKACLLLLTTALFAPLTANACVTVNVHNDSNETLRVDWGGVGCAKIDAGDDDQWFVCKHHYITPADGAKSFDFDWGVTKHWVAATFDGLGEAHQIRVQLKYSYKLGRGFHKTGSLGADSPTKCHKHYNIHVTTKDMQAQSEVEYAAFVEQQGQPE